MKELRFKMGILKKYVTIIASFEVNEGFLFQKENLTIKEL